jgi:hypothetical protein
MYQMSRKFTGVLSGIASGLVFCSIVTREAEFFKGIARIVNIAYLLEFLVRDAIKPKLLFTQHVARERDEPPACCGAVSKMMLRYPA